MVRHCPRRLHGSRAAAGCSLPSALLGTTSMAESHLAQGHTLPRKLTTAQHRTTLTCPFSSGLPRLWSGLPYSMAASAPPAPWPSLPQILIPRSLINIQHIQLLLGVHFPENPACHRLCSLYRQYLLTSLFWSCLLCHSL